MITHMVMRKDYEVARYQRLTKPLIELSDDVVDIDNFALPLKKKLVFGITYAKTTYRYL